MTATDTSLSMIFHRRHALYPIYCGAFVAAVMILETRAWQDDFYCHNRRKSLGALT